MKVSPVTVLRLALPGEPSGRQVARRLGLSANAIHKFELGRGSLSPANLAAYAKLVGVPVREVRKRWLIARLDAHEGEILKLRAALRSLGVQRLRAGKRPGHGPNATPAHRG